MHAPNAPKNEILQAALQYAEHGWLVFPVHPDTKKPVTDNGLHDATRDEQTIREWWARWPGAMAAVQTGPESGIWVLDLDIDSEESIDGVAAFAALAEGKEPLPETCRTRTPRGGTHLFFKWRDGVHNSASKIARGVDTRGIGGYCVLPPSKGSNGNYECLCSVYPDLPEAPEWLIDLIVKAEPAAPDGDPELAAFAAVGGRIGGGNGKGYGPAALTAETARVAGAPRGQRNHTLNTAAFNLGQLVAAGVLDEGEVRHSLFDAATACGLVQEDGRASVEATIKSGLSAGLKQPRQIPERDQETPHAKAKDDTPKPPPLPFLDITKWQHVEPPPRAWVVLDRVPLNNITLLSGEGAVGKTILGLHLCVATVLARDWISRMPEPGPVIAVCCEDDDGELHRRLDPIVRHYQTSYAEISKLKLISLAGKDALLATPRRDGLLEPTKLFARMLEAARDIKPKLIMIDNSADVYGGNENDRAQVRQFIGMLRGLTMTANAGLLLTSHPSLTGMTSGSGLSGSTAWNASVRARLYLKRATIAKDEEPDPDLRILEVMKNNYGPAGEAITLRWNDGLFLPVAQLGSLEKLARGQRVNDLFLKLLDRRTEQGRAVTDKPKANNFAPTCFADEPETKADKITKAELKDAMTRLFAAGKIRSEPYSSPCRDRSKLVRK
jgi:RecA-family ATPase